MSTNNTLFIGKVAHKFERLPSTNAHAIDLLTKTKPVEGTVIVTADQYAGKGQFGSNWTVDPASNLTLSVILYPTFLVPADQFFLSQLVALAVAKTAQDVLPPTTEIAVKWPNDVLVNDRKVCGILIQNSISSQQIQWSVLGIGLNVNQTHFPSALHRAISLQQVTGQPLSLSDLQNTLLYRLEQLYLQLRAGHRSEISTNYQQQLYRRGESSEFVRANGLRFTGTILGVLPSGELRIQTKTREEHFQLKEVRFADFN